MSTSALLAADASQALLAGPGDGHWDGPGWWLLVPIFWVLVVAAAVTAFVVVGRRNRALAGARAGEARLAERFAAGEIGEQEYRDRLAVIKEQSR